MKKHVTHILLTVFVLGAFALQALHAKEDARLLRFPDINDDLIAFVYAGDIWTVDADGGEARRLTSHKGLELFPKISPDGKWIAFSAQYSGSRQVYVMPSEGGQPKQLTYYNDVGMMPPRGGWDYVVLDWTPDSKQILFRANRTPYGKRNGKYFKVSIDGGKEQPLEIPEGGFGVFSPDANKMAYAPISREFRSWKRYKGGRASDIWIYDLKNSNSWKITDFEGTDQIPTWDGNTIYFASDRDKTLNIYGYNTESEEINQVTEYETYDVMWPSGHNGQIVYENGGYIYKLNLADESTEKVTVDIHFDNPNTLPYYKNVKEDIHSFNISPKGNRALFDARGDIFSVPAKTGRIQNITQTQGVREIYPATSPDGKWITYITDVSGEYELYLKERNGNAKPVQLTENSSAWKYQPIWSPDSKFLVYSDRTLDLKILNVKTQKERVIAHANTEELRHYRFSPDSKWVTYTRNSDNNQKAVWVYNVENGNNQQLTSDKYNDMSPVFSNDGNYIFFLSNRDFNLDFSDFEFHYLYNDATRIYAMALTSESPALFREQIEHDNDMQEKSNADGTDADVRVTIEPDGIQHRIINFPLSTSDYRNLIPVKDGLLYITKDGLHKYDIHEEKDQVMLSGARQAKLSADGSKLLYHADKDYGIVDLAPNQKAGDGKLNFENMEMKIDPREEWNQIFTDGWRIFRDYFYVKNMHGVDWKAIYDKYEELLPHVSHRADLDYLLSEMVAESNAGHAYVNYGDFDRVDRIETGLLGARLKADKNARRFVIDKIFKGENWHSDRRAPLTRQGVNVEEGDYLLAINGNEVRVGENPYKHLENTVGELVEITVNSNPSYNGAKTYTIKPIKHELSLMYLDWVQTRREKVNELSDGKIGYIHVPNTAYEGNRELFKGMYAYHDKEALIIDDRYNGGGFIPDVMTNLLDRETLAYWHRQGLDPMKTPAVAHDGPKAMLINHYSSSGGDAFPYFFKKKDLGVVLGTRTWGGLVGISGNASLVDGGYIAVPRFGIYNKEGEWIIEGEGVHPDIQIVDTPHKVAKGQDPTLEKAVEVLMEKLENDSTKTATPPEHPDRSGWIQSKID